MSRKRDLAALGADIYNAQARAKNLGLALVEHLLAMAHLELIECEAEYDVLQLVSVQSEDNI